MTVGQRLGPPSRRRGRRGFGVAGAVHARGVVDQSDRAAQNWHEHREHDCLIKTKHRDGRWCGSDTM